MDAADVRLRARRTMRDVPATGTRLGDIDEAHPTTGREQRRWFAMQVPEHRRRGAEQSPSTRRRQWVHGAVPIGDRDRPGGNALTRAGQARHGQLGRQTAEVGEPGCEADERDGEVERRVRTPRLGPGHPPVRCDIGEVGPVVDDRDLHDSASGWPTSAQPAIWARKDAGSSTPSISTVHTPATISAPDGSAPCRRRSTAAAVSAGTSCGSPASISTADRPYGRTVHGAGATPPPPAATSSPGTVAA